ncbi:putative Fe-S oxidoreductase [Minicystis rosea]|nr:putative Fe-S oxidoreductase [Minicystis rosea]
MFSRAAPGALLAASLLVAGPRSAFAQDPKPAVSASAAPASPPAPAPAAPASPPAPAPAAPASAAPATPAAPAPQAQPHGAIVVAVGDGAGPAARALAMEVYRDAALRPPIDEATARVLAGDVPRADAPPRLKELGELRVTLAKAESELISRRLLASLGTEVGAPLVVSVTLDGGRPIARALRTPGTAFERVELGATVETAPDGAKTFRWPGATTTLRGFLGIAPETPAAEPLRPVAPKAPDAPATPERRPFYKSPWFWGTAGAVVAAGLTVLILSRTNSGPSDVHVSGKVGQ